VTQKFLVDANILSELVRNPAGVVRDRIALAGEAAVATSCIVAAELRYGALKKGSTALTQRIEGVLERLPVLPFEPPADAAYARIRHQLEQKGQPIGANDLLIAAQAIAGGLVLVTDNIREFARVEGLQLENWLR
jgi:tRNA(fMet)-specific endonuclease VapC